MRLKNGKNCGLWALTLALMLMMNAPALLGGAWTRPAGGWFGKMYLATGEAGSFSDSRGESVSGIDISGSSDTSGVTNLTFEYNELIVGIYAEYGITDDFTVIADLPWGHFSLKEKYRSTRIVDGQPQEARSDSNFSISSFLFYGLGGRYRIIQRNRMTASLAASIRIPPGGSDGIVDNPDYDFLSDGAMEVAGGLELGLSTDFGWVAGAVKYRHRGEELEDEFFFHLEAGFNNIPEAFFKFKLDVIQSLTTFAEAREFNIREQPLQSNMIVPGVAFALTLSERYFLDVSYDIRLDAKNSWRIGTFSVGIGVEM